MRLCSLIGGSEHVQENNWSRLSFGIRARRDSLSAYSVKSRDRSVQAKNLGSTSSLTLIGYISALHTPRNSATTTFRRYGRSFEYRTSPGSNRYLPLIKPSSAAVLTPARRHVPLSTFSPFTCGSLPNSGIRGSTWRAVISQTSPRRTQRQPAGSGRPAPRGAVTRGPSAPTACRAARVIVGSDG